MVYYIASHTHTTYTHTHTHSAKGLVKGELITVATTYNLDAYVKKKVRLLYLLI